MDKTKQEGGRVDHSQSGRIVIAILLLIGILQMLMESLRHGNGAEAVGDLIANLCVLRKIVAKVIHELSICKFLYLI